MARKSFRLAINPKSFKESGPVLSTEFLFYFVFDESGKKIVAFLWFVKNSLTFQVFCDLCCEIILSSECAGTDFLRLSSLIQICRHQEPNPQPPWSWTNSAYHQTTASCCQTFLILFDSSASFARPRRTRRRRSRPSSRSRDSNPSTTRKTSTSRSKWPPRFTPTSPTRRSRVRIQIWRCRLWRLTRTSYLVLTTNYILFCINL